MARESKFLKLYLPGRSDNYDVERDQNDNFLKLDAAAEQAQKMATDLFSKKQDKEDNNLATTNKTVVGAINESKAYTDGLAGLQGENSFPLSQATEGQVYKEPNTKKYYVCLKNYSGGLISVPNGNFEELSVLENRSKLNDIESEEISTVISGGIRPYYLVFTKIGNWVMVTGQLTLDTSERTFNNVIPIRFRPKETITITGLLGAVQPPMSLSVRGAKFTPDGSLVVNNYEKRIYVEISAKFYLV